MNIAIGTYGDPLSLEKELAIDSFNHTFVDGVSGVGKSTLLEDVAIQLIRAGKPLLYIDPHGTSAPHPGLHPEAVQWAGRLYQPTREEGAGDIHLLREDKGGERTRHRVPQ